MAVPSAGFALLTLPAAIVALFAVVTLPTTRPTLFNFASAADCVKPTKSGTATWAGPPDTSRLTADPELTGIPPVGSALLTLPTGIVALLAVVTLPTAKPTLFNFASAADWVRPTKSGTLMVSGSAIF
jgi:hypothetical protein